MKNIFKTLLCLVAFIVPVSGLFAQVVGEQQDVPDEYHYPDNEDGTGIVYSKIVQGPNKKGEYTIFLKSFVTGEVDEQTMAIPTEVVLVLDVSGSMDWGMTDEDYTANNAQYSYNTINNSSTMYLYKYNDEYLRVYAGTNYYGNRYCLYTGINGVTYYFTQNGGLTTSSNQAYWREGANQTIFNGTLYTVTAGHSRMAALKEAVNYFITEINNNSETLPAGKTNKISIVKFANNSFCNSSGTAVNYNTGASDSNETGNHRGADGISAYNYTEIVNGFLPSSSSSLSTNVNGLIAGGATAADYGMVKAELLINTLFNNPNTDNPTPKELTNKIVVFFTDGEPTYSSGFEDDVANDAVSIAKRLKALTAYEYRNQSTGTTITGKVKVYTIGTFKNPSEKTETYMHRLSSNYPNATSIGEGGEGADGSELNGFYFMATSKEKLKEAFGSISNDIVSPDITVNSSSTVVDVMSKSFTLPTGTSASSVQVWETKAQSYNTTTKQYEFSINKSDWQNITDAQGLILNVVGDQVTVSGWAFDKNACARKQNGSVIGKQLILEIPIEMGPNAVGGLAVGTNGAGSGLSYVDEHGVSQKLYFETPNIGLPINLHIRKEGLKKGESAKFRIQRMWDGKTTIPSDVVITPNTWQDYTSVFVTRRETNTETGENAPIVRIVGLHPGFTYRIKEEGWSWSYGVTKVHGNRYTINPETQVETIDDITMNNGTNEDWSDNTVLSTSINLNPFIFVNTKKDVESTTISVRHAESIVTNDFKDFDSQSRKTGVTVNSKKQAGENE